MKDLTPIFLRESHNERPDPNFPAVFLALFFLLSLPVYLLSEILFKVSGKVEYQGKGISHMVVYAIDVTDEKTHKKDSKTTTDESGDFSFYLSNGDYSIHIERPHPVYVIKGENSLKISVRNKNILNIDISLEKACSIIGRIAFEDGSPIRRSIDLLLQGQGSRYGIEEYELGNYRIFGIRPSNKIILEITPYGIIGDKVFEFAIAPGEEKTFNLTLPKRISIKGKVVSGIENNSIEGVLILLYQSNPINEEIAIGTAEYWTDDSGNFFFYNLPPGKYYIWCVGEVAGEAAIDHPIIIELGNNELKQIDIQMK